MESILLEFLMTDEEIYSTDSNSSIDYDPNTDILEEHFDLLLSNAYFDQTSEHVFTPGLTFTTKTKLTDLLYTNLDFVNKESYRYGTGSQLIRPRKYKKINISPITYLNNRQYGRGYKYMTNFVGRITRLLPATTTIDGQTYNYLECISQESHVTKSSRWYWNTFKREEKDHYSVIANNIFQNTNAIMYEEIKGLFLKPVWMINFLSRFLPTLGSLLDKTEMKIVMKLIDTLTMCVKNAEIEETDGTLPLEISWDSLNTPILNEELSTMYTMDGWPVLKVVLMKLKEKVPREEYCSSQIINSPIMNISTSSMIARGIPDPATATTSETIVTDEDLEGALFGAPKPITPDTGNMSQSISTYHQDKVCTITSEAPYSKYAVLMRVMDMGKVRKMERKDFWKGRVKEIFCGIPPMSPTSLQLTKMLQQMQNLVKNGANLTELEKLNKLSSSSRTT